MCLYKTIIELAICFDIRMVRWMAACLVKTRTLVAVTRKQQPKILLWRFLVGHRLRRHKCMVFQVGFISFYSAYFFLNLEMYLFHNYVNFIWLCNGFIECMPWPLAILTPKFPFQPNRSHRSLVNIIRMMRLFNSQNVSH